MEKNYYQILEVDKNASDEIIDKAYKTLAKKYHPDLQNPETQKEYEEKMKLINEAYSILSDDFKRSTYNKQLEESTVPMQEYKKIIQQNNQLIKEIARLTNNTQTVNQIYNQQYNNNINRVVNQSYQGAYVQNLKNRRYKKTFKDYKKAIISVAITILVLLLISQIPFVKRFLIQLYQENVIIKAIVDVFINTFKSGF